MRSLLRLMRPDNFEDISAVLALYRPGPMGADSHTNYALRKNGRQEITPIHPELEEPLAEILGTTHGLIVYQEQVMAIAQKVAGYTLGQADLLRRAMGKKKKEILDAEFEPFSAGMRGQRLLRPRRSRRSGTSWSRSPTTRSTRRTRRRTGWSPTGPPTSRPTTAAEFMAALLTSVADDKDKMAIYLDECRRMGIQVLPPDVNESAANFTPVGTDIRFGLTAVRNVGAQRGRRDRRRPRPSTARRSTSTASWTRSPLVVCNKRVIESLIKAGAFESMGHTRRALMSVYESAVDGVLDLKRNEAHGQDDLFGDSTATDGDGRPGADRARSRTCPTGTSGPSSPSSGRCSGSTSATTRCWGWSTSSAAERDISIGELLADDGPREGMVTIAGMITSVTRKTTKRGDIWAVITVEDLEASIEVLLFPKAYDLVSTVLATDVVVRVKGRVKSDDDAVSINATELTLPDVTDAPDRPGGHLAARRPLHPAGGRSSCATCSPPTRG